MCGIVHNFLINITLRGVWATGDREIFINGFCSHSAEEKKSKSYFLRFRPEMVQKKTKTKVLTPTLKEKKRYIVYDINYFGKRTSSYGRVMEAVDNGVLGLVGELGYGGAGVMFIKGSGKRGIIRVGRNHVDHVKTGLMTIKKIDNHDVAVRCIGLSGSLAKAEQICTRGGV
tara:strand:+ start:2092 stop:2607 length:516 start_codon:yes stop_codon:yes gene_type:complete